MSNESVGIILTLYKRDNLQLQLESILKQSILPNTIYVWQNESHVEFKISPDIDKISRELGIKINHIHSKDKNFKFHGRFTLPLLMEEEYIAIFDDDTIPGVRWIENCINHSRKYNCIVGANGRTIVEEDEKGTGDGAPVPVETFVDFVGHCWFFRREWIHYLWRFYPNTFDNGEDIHFAAACKILGNIDCIVPSMPPNDLSLWGDLCTSLGCDDHATWKKSTHSSVRKSVKDYWLSMGWKTINSQ